MRVDLPWFTSRPYLDTLARLEALAATPMRRRKVVWYHRPPAKKGAKQ